MVLDEHGISKGYAFVHFESEDAAKKAIDRVNGMMLNNKKVYVGKFIPQSERVKQMGERVRVFSNIYVKNFGKQLDSAGLHEMFSQFGNITSAVVMTNDDGSSKGFGFVAFDAPEPAAAAVMEMHGKEVEGRPLYVARAQKSSERMAELKRKYEQIKTERFNR